MLVCKILLWSVFVISVSLKAQNKETVFFKKEKLKKQLLLHYKNDVQKQQAATFLINNIDIQNSQNYNWVDQNDKIVPYNELDYKNIDEAVTAFKKLKDSLKIRPRPYKLMDIEVVTSNLLIKNIDLAFDAWKNNPWSKSYNFNTFCNYILPYRSLVEPLEDWRQEYQLQVTNTIQAVADIDKPAAVATSAIQTLKNYNFVQSRPDPIPFLSPKQLLFRREGACPDLANLTLLACRSIGLAVTFDFTPFNGASSNRHFWNTIITEKGEHIPFDGNCFNNPSGLPYAYKATAKRLAKVFRKTYAIQPAALATIHNAAEIPEGFLKEKNIFDVTNEYVPTATINYPIEKTTKATIGFLNVFNVTKWQTIDWGVRKNNSIEFKNLGTQIVYLPSVYLPEVQKMQYADYPILVDVDKNQVVLKPNYAKTFSYKITRDKTIKGPTLDFNSFEVFENEVFKLLVWDKGWKELEQVQSVNNAIPFSKIPDNGLFLVICKKSNGFERIFRINTTTKQIEWY